MADPTNPYAGLTVADLTPIDPKTGQPIVQRAQPVSSVDLTPNMDKQDASTYGSLMAAQALAKAHASGVNMTPENYFTQQQDYIGKAIEYQAGKQKTLYEKQLEEAQKVLEAAPGGLKEQEARIAAQSAQTQKQEEQGPAATAQALQQGVFPGQGKVSALISKPTDQQQKDWAAYTEGFHNLQNLHTLFDNMATKTVGAGGPWQSLAGLTTPITNLTSPEARVYHSYVDSSLIPLAKSIMGDAATTAGKETVQSAMTEALPNAADTLQTGGQKMFTFYQRALDKIQTERDMARKNGFDTGSIDTALNDFHSFFNSDAVQKYNPFKNQSIVQSGNSPQGRQQIANAMLAGSNPPAPQTQVTPAQFTPSAAMQGGVPGPNWWASGRNPNMFSGMQMSGTSALPPETPSPAEMGLVNLPGQTVQTIKSLLPKPGGPAEDLTLPSY